MTRTATLPRWRRRPEARPEEVLDAALDAFMAHGYAATRMEDVARACGLSKAALYLYFPSKEAIFRALVAGRLQPLREAAEAAVAAAQDDVVGGLRAIIGFWVTVAGDERLAALPRLVLSEASQFPEIAAAYHEMMVSRASEAIGGLIERGMAQGLFRPVDPQAAARMLLAPLALDLWRRHAFAGLEPAPRAPADVAALTLDLFLNGVGALERAP
jgi:AcrR family transcriptional regulator